MMKALVRYCIESAEAMSSTAKGVLVNRDFSPVISMLYPGWLLSPPEEPGPKLTPSRKNPQ
jgi:hypothetical protein